MTEIVVQPLLGSLRQRSYNRMLLTAAQSLAPAGMRILDPPDLRPVPLYDGDVESSTGVPEVVTAMGDALRAADAILFVTPEYNFSIPGALKNTIDWLSRDPQHGFRGKPVGIMGASNGPVGTARMQYHLRQVLVSLEALPLTRPEILVAMCEQRFDLTTGALTDDATRSFVAGYLGRLRDWTLQLRPSD